MITQFKIFETYDVNFDDMGYPDVNDCDYYAEKVCQKFGYTTVSVLGSGDMGYAYEIVDRNGDHKVLKITTDKYEARVAEKLRKRPVTKHLVNYYDVRVLNDGYYSIIMDLVGELDQDEFNTINAVIIELRSMFYKNIRNEQSEIKQFYFSSDLVGKLLKNNEFRKKFNSDEYLDQLYELHLELKKNGLKGKDIATRNMGKNDDGDFVFFDIGIEPISNKRFKLKSF